MLKRVGGGGVRVESEEQGESEAQKEETAVTALPRDLTSRGIGF